MTRSPRGYEDAADRPHVDLGIVVLLQENELGRAVPARDDVFSHHIGVLLYATRETEVADGEVAVAVDQDVGRLQVTMQNLNVEGEERLRVRSGGT